MNDGWVAERGFQGQEELFHFDCLLCGQRLLSDKFAVEELCGGAVFKVESTLSFERGGDAESKTIDETGFVVDLADAYQLRRVALSKREYVAATKSYFARLERALEQQGRADWQQRSQSRQQAIAFLKTVVLPDFRNFAFYTAAPPDGDHTEGMLVLGRWEGAQLAFYYWKDGLKVVREKPATPRKRPD